MMAPNFSTHCRTVTYDVEPSFGQEFLNIAVAQGEAEIQPDGVLDDLGREAMAAIAERGHADFLPDTLLAPSPVSVTLRSRPLITKDQTEQSDGLRIPSGEIEQLVTSRMGQSLVDLGSIYPATRLSGPSMRSAG
jgi:hypothetical protein